MLSDTQEVMPYPLLQRGAGTLGSPNQRRWSWQSEAGGCRGYWGAASPWGPRTPTPPHLEPQRDEESFLLILRLINLNPVAFIFNLFLDPAVGWLTVFLRALLKGGVVEAGVVRPHGSIATGVIRSCGWRGRVVPQDCLRRRPGRAGHHRSLVPTLASGAVHIGLLTPRPGTPFTKQQASVC